MRRRQDLTFVALAAAHGATVFAVPVFPLIAAGVWWNSNTIAHNFVHRQFFCRPWANVIFGLYQSALLGIPQTLWRDRHLAHHADRPWRWRWSPALGVEVVLIITVWSLLATMAPAFFVATYLPAYLAGLGLCAMQGHYEHPGAVTTSHYGRVYNLLCFNDGYHCEHHAFPGVHWADLPQRALPAPRVSRWPALLRWFEAFSLDGLEKVVLRSARLQHFIVDAHRGAIRKTLAGHAHVQRVVIIGGGLFPRTALVLQELMPTASVVLVDSSQTHLDLARAFLQSRPSDARPIEEFRLQAFSAGDAVPNADLVILPLAFRGNREALYDRPPAPLVLIHDWCWRRRGAGRIVSLWLLKRVNLIRT